MLPDGWKPANRLIESAILWAFVAYVIYAMLKTP